MLFSLDLIVRQVFDRLHDVSLERVLRYFDTTIARMKATNPDGLLTDRITASSLVRTQFFGSATAADAALTLQTTQTDAVDALVAKMKKELGDRYEGAVRGVFGKGTDGYKAFFPYGLNEYTQATRETTPGLVERLWNAAEAHKNDLAPAAVAALQGYKTDWDGLRAEQLERIGTTDSEQTGVTTARQAVYKQQYLNLHYLCYVLEGDEDRILSYFDQSIVAPRTRVHEYPFQGSVAGGTVAQIRRLTDHDADITCHNAGKGELRLVLSAQPDAVEPANAEGKPVAAGQTVALQADALGDIKATPYLLIVNPGPDAGQYEGEVEEDGK